jgi:CPA2 family monovalent cation:H+ antiporter-2
MHEGHELLKALTVVLCTAGVTTVLCQRLHQPVVLGYLLAGLIVGPHVPIPLRADRQVVQSLSELGVILLMFALGLEFSLRKLVRVGPTAGLTAVIQCSIMLWLGFLVGRAFGWSVLESVFVGALISISSTTIIAKAFDEQAIGGRLRELVVGVLIVEDLIAVLLMAVLIAIGRRGEMSAWALTWSGIQLTAFLVGLMTVGLLVVPRLMRAVLRLRRTETTLVASIGLCFAVALFASELGYSVALGAFIAGSLVAESGEVAAIDKLVLPVRDMFAAIFFVSVGMLIDPRLIAEHWVAVLVLIAVVILGKVMSVSVGAFLTGNGIATSVKAGMSMAQIGEFSFIIAGLAISLKVAGEFLYAVAVAVSALTTLTTPWLIRLAGRVASFVDRNLPLPLQTFATLYGSWLERIRSAPASQSIGSRLRRLAGVLVVDALAVAVIVIVTAVKGPVAVAFLQRQLTLSEPLSRALVAGAAALLAVPFGAGILRVSQRLGATLAASALPELSEGKLDLAAAPRRALVVTLQLAIVLLLGLPLLALTQPFLPRYVGVLVLLPLLAVLAVAFWRSTTNLEGHVRAGSEMLVEMLKTQTYPGSAPSREDPFSRVEQLLPGLGEPTAVELEEQSAAVGKTLAEINLRGLTGASVLALRRGNQGILAPSPREALRCGDVLALAGTREGVEAARGLLLHGPSVPQGSEGEGTQGLT